MNAAGISLKSTIVLSTTAMLMAAPLMAAADSGTPQIKSFAFTKTLPKAPVDPLGVNDYSRLPNIGPGTSSGALSISLGFEGTSDFDTRALGIGVIPPDTMGAVGTTQYVQLINGSFTVYNKSDGSLAAPRKTDSSWWTSLGGTTTGGDPRVMFDPVTSRWLALGFDDTLGGVNLGVSATDNALGAWNVTTLSINAGGIADYPTLSISGNSVVIGTNNFSSVGGGQRSRAGNRARRQMVLEGQVEIELARRQALEEGQYPAATASGHEVIRILHAGGNAGQHARRTHSERREPER